MRARVIARTWVAAVNLSVTSSPWRGWTLMASLSTALMTPRTRCCGVVTWAQAETLATRLHASHSVVAERRLRREDILIPGGAGMPER